MKQASLPSRSKADGLPSIAGRIMAGLTRGLDWFDDSLQNVLASRGFEPLHRTQSMIIMHIALGIDSPSDIAREMSLTRQNVHHMARALIDLGVIESQPDPADRRRSLYRLSDRAKDVRGLALATMASLELLLERRIGCEHVDALREAFIADWGPEVADAAELEASSVAKQRRPRN